MHDVACENLRAQLRYAVAMGANVLKYCAFRQGRYWIYYYHYWIKTGQINAALCVWRMLDQTKSIFKIHTYQSSGSNAQIWTDDFSR